MRSHLAQVAPASSSWHRVSTSWQAGPMVTITAQHGIVLQKQLLTQGLSELLHLRYTKLVIVCRLYRHAAES